jgi:nicotinamide-nucleotide amidase
MPTCELITIGTELLGGRTLNTNAQFLAKRITDLNLEVAYQTSCLDRESDICQTLQLAFRRSDLILVTGGLGPTPDDITREAVASYFRCDLKFNPGQYRQIVRHFRSARHQVPLMTRREAFFPAIAKPLLNRFGIALGFYVLQKKKLLVALPGVPRELIGMYETRVKPLIKRVFRNRPQIHSFEAHIIGLYETEIIRRLGKSFFRGRTFDFGIYPEIGEVTIRLKARAGRLISVLRRELMRKLGHSIYGFESESIAQVIGRKLTLRGNTLAAAESCTGGLLAKRLTDPPGASRYFLGGVISYSNELKMNMLGVPAELIRKRGAVYAHAAKVMALNVRKNQGASLGISITGIAGPTGGTRLKPIGLVFIGISDRKKTAAHSFRFTGERDKIRLQATQKALELIWKWLRR